MLDIKVLKVVESDTLNKDGKRNITYEDPKFVKSVLGSDSYFEIEQNTATNDKYQIEITQKEDATPTDDLHYQISINPQSITSLQLDQSMFDTVVENGNKIYAVERIRP